MRHRWQSESSSGSVALWCRLVTDTKAEPVEKKQTFGGATA